MEDENKSASSVWISTKFMDTFAVLEGKLAKMQKGGPICSSFSGVGISDRRW